MCWLRLDDLERWACDDEDCIPCVSTQIIIKSLEVFLLFGPWQRCVICGGYGQENREKSVAFIAL